jgi:hypothetical protein
MGEFPIRSALQKWRDMGEIAETLSEPWGVAGGSGSLIDVCGEKSEIGVEIYIYMYSLAKVMSSNNGIEGSARLNFDTKFDG